MKRTLAWAAGGSRRWVERLGAAAGFTLHARYGGFPAHTRVFGKPQS